MRWDSYCYGVNIQPHDIRLTFQTDCLQITDSQEVPPTQSPTLQLWCLAQEQALAVQCYSDYTGHRLRVPRTEWEAFLQLLKQVYPAVAAYWTHTLEFPTRACVNLSVGLSHRSLASSGNNSFVNPY